LGELLNYYLFRSMILNKYRTSFVAAILLSGVALFSGCSKQESVRIRLDAQETVTIPLTIDRYATYEASTSNRVNDLSAALVEKGFSLDDADTAYIAALELNVIQPSAENFRFCREVSIYLTAPGMPDILLGEKSDPSKLSGNPLFLFRTDANLMEYFKKGEFAYKAVFKMRQLFDEEIQVRIKPIYFVEAKKSN
jgi:hypothetical protein